MSTMQQLCDLARIPMNDDGQARYPDTEMIRYANAGIGAAYKIRPDLKFGGYATEFVPLTLAGAFPLPEHFMQVLADYICFRCETKNDEAANIGRAAAYMALFEKEVMSL